MSSTQVPAGTTCVEHVLGGVAACCHAGLVITEHALLPVVAGQEVAFEAAFAEATALIAGSPGFVDLSLSRGVERPGTYLLLVRWRTVADHEQRFRGSPAHHRWRELLHGFYEPFPLVEHFEPVARA